MRKKKLYLNVSISRGEIELMKEKKGTFKITAGFDCLSACISNVELLFGNQVRDEDVFFFVGERNLYYDNEKQLLYTDSHECIKQWLERHHILVENKKKFQHESPIGYIRKKLLLNKKIVLCVKTECLNYRSIFLDNLPTNHYIVVCDCDIITGKLYVIDGFIPNNDSEFFSGWVNAKEIVNAWEKTECSHYCFERSVFKETISLRKSSKMNFEATVSSYLLNNNTDCVVSGEAAIECFVNSLTEDSDFENKINQMKVFGFTTIKRYVCKCIKEDSRLYLFFRDYLEIVESWDVFCLMLFKFYITKRYNGLEKIKIFAKELITREHELISDIDKQLK